MRTNEGKLKFTMMKWYNDTKNFIIFKFVYAKPNNRLLL